MSKSERNMLKKEFLKELKELLKKYNTYIGFNCRASSDLNGISAPTVGVCDKESHQELFITDGFTLFAADIEVGK